MDQEGTAGETASGNPVEVLVECVFKNKVLISLNPNSEGVPATHLSEGGGHIVPPPW